MTWFSQKVEFYLYYWKKIIEPFIFKGFNKQILKGRKNKYSKKNLQVGYTTIFFKTFSPFDSLSIVSEPFSYIVYSTLTESFIVVYDSVFFLSILRI